MKAVPVGLALTLLALLAGCSMHQRIDLNPDGSGKADVRIVLAPLVVKYMDDILAGIEPTSAGNGPALFDAARIRSAFAELPGVRLTQVSTPERGTLELRFDFSDVGRLIPPGTGDANAAGGSSKTGPIQTPQQGGGPESPLSFSDHGGVKTVRLLLSRATWPAVARLPPLQGDPLLASLGPRAGSSYTREEYLNLLEYAFSDYASKERVQSALEASAIDIELVVKGTIVSQKGGERSGNTVSYHLPLLDVVTLEKPIDLSVSFR